MGTVTAKALFVAELSTSVKVNLARHDREKNLNSFVRAEGAIEEFVSLGGVHSWEFMGCRKGIAAVRRRFARQRGADACAYAARAGVDFVQRHFRWLAAIAAWQAGLAPCSSRAGAIAAQARAARAPLRIGTATPRRAAYRAWWPEPPCGRVRATEQRTSCGGACSRFSMDYRLCVCDETDAATSFQDGTDGFNHFTGLFV